MSFVDKFNRADSADVGNGWTEENAGAFSISGNQLRAAGNVYDDMVIAPSVSDISDGFLSIDFTLTNTALMPQLWGRIDKPGGRGVFCWHHSGRFRISEQTGLGQSHSERATNQAVSLTAGNRYRMEMTITGLAATARLIDLDDSETEIANISTADGITRSTTGPSGTSIYGNSNPCNYDRFICAPAGVPCPVDYGASDTYAGTGATVVSGLNFGATQGSATAIISPTNDPNDPAATTQTISAWADNSITIAGAFPAGAQEGYLFVTNDTGQQNASGLLLDNPITTESINVTDAFSNGTSIMPNEAGITAHILNPADASLVDTVTGLTTNASGILSTITSASMAATTVYWLIVEFAGGEIAFVRGVST